MRDIGRFMPVQCKAAAKSGSKVSAAAAAAAASVPLNRAHLPWAINALRV